MVWSHPQYTEYEVSIYSKVVGLWFTKSSVSAAELNLELKTQANNIRISPNLTYGVISLPIDLIWSFNWFWGGLIMVHQELFFCCKNWTILEISTNPSLFLFFFFLIYWYDLETVIRWNITLSDANLVITQPTIKIDICSRKAKIGLIGVWHNRNLSKATSTIGLSRMTPWTN